MKVAIFILISVILNALVFVTQAGIDYASSEMGVEGTTLATSSSHIDQFNKGNYELDQDYLSALPEGSGEVDASTDTNIFTDTWNKLISWVKTPFSYGYKYLIEPLTILPNFVKRLFPGDFAEIGFYLGYIWQIATLISIIILFKGGEAN